MRINNYRRDIQAYNPNLISSGAYSSQTYLSIWEHSKCTNQAMMLYICYTPHIDIDECLALEGPCGNNSVCTNTNGSFLCDCLSGFTGDGIDCQGQC